MTEFYIHLSKKSNLRRCVLEQKDDGSYVRFYDESGKDTGCQPEPYVRDLIEKGTWGFIKEEDFNVDKEFYPSGNTSIVVPNYIQETIDKLKLIDDNVESLSSSIRKIEDAVSDCYHYIELGNLNGAQTMKVAKKLKQLLKERRALRDEISLCLTIKQNSKQVLEEYKKLIDSRTDRSYTWKQLSLEDILGS
tara:strand:+ start:89 stop:664 length:576 start_codon:yes stop_codon:yes gene_type:complete